MKGKLTYSRVGRMAYITSGRNCSKYPVGKNA